MVFSFQRLQLHEFSVSVLTLGYVPTYLVARFSLVRPVRYLLIHSLHGTGYSFAKLRVT
jgi:hypothetical protein